MQWPLTAYWLVPNDFLNLLSYTTQEHLLRSNTTPSLVVSPTLIKKTTYRLPLLRCSSLCCQVEKKKKKKQGKRKEEGNGTICGRLERAHDPGLRWDPSHYSFVNELDDHLNQAPGLRSKGSLN